MASSEVCGWKTENGVQNPCTIEEQMTQKLATSLLRTDLLRLKRLKTMVMRKMIIDHLRQYHVQQQNYKHDAISWRNVWWLTIKWPCSLAKLPWKSEVDHIHAIWQVQVLTNNRRISDDANDELITVFYGVTHERHSPACSSMPPSTLNIERWTFVYDTTYFRPLFVVRFLQLAAVAEFLLSSVSNVFSELVGLTQKRRIWSLSPSLCSYLLVTRELFGWSSIENRNL